MPKTQYVFRDLSDDADRRIADLFGQTPSGQSSLRQKWGRGLLHIALLPVESSIFAFEIWQRAYQIARSRHEDADLRDLASALDRYESEMQELKTAVECYHQQQCALVNVGYRVSSVLYYAVQVYALNGDMVAFERRCQNASARAEIPLPVARELAKAKFGSRGERAESGQRKDVPEETRRMQEILDASQIPFKKP